MKSHSPHRRAFTIPEMLAVVAIIAIVISILLPTMVRSRDVANTMLCANNLHQLHTAYVTRNADVRMRTVEKTSAYSWQSALLPYTDGVNKVYFCQSQAEGVLGAGGAGSGGGASVAGNMYLKVFNAYPNGYLYDMAMEEGPLCRRIHKSTTDATIDALWAGKASVASTIKSFRNGLPNENSYLLCFEDLRPGGGDLDFEDVIFSVEEKDDGVNVKFLYDGAGYKFDLMNRDGTVLAAELDNGGQTKPGTVVFAPGAATSYGMTDQAVKKFVDGGKNVIFMLDYQRTVASCAGSSGFDPWNDWLKPNGIEQFARHSDKANVMFFDGGVRLMSTFSIKPSIAQNRTDYWIP